MTLYKVYTYNTELYPVRLMRRHQILIYEDIHIRIKAASKKSKRKIEAELDSTTGGYIGADPKRVEGVILRMPNLYCWKACIH